MTDEDGTATLEAIASGALTRCLLPWIPLMPGGGESAMIERWKPLAEAEPDSRRRSDYGALALVFAEAAGRRPDWAQALEKWNMIESQQVLEWMSQGKARGKETGRVEGRAQGKAEALLQLLEAKFSLAVPGDLATTIKAATDVAQLERWFKGAIKADSLDAFRQVLASDPVTPGGPVNGTHQE